MRGVMRGKAQRVIRLLREGATRPIYVHGAMQPAERASRRHGRPRSLEPQTEQDDISRARSCSVRPRRTGRGAGAATTPVISFASGWMNVRARARQRAVELPLVISDHADWDELTDTIAEVNPGELWITHGEEEGLQRWCELQGRPARALRLVGYEDDAE